MAATGEARRIRERSLLTQAEVGAALGVTSSAVARWEAGNRRPRGPVAERYGLLLDALLSNLPKRRKEDV
jgi:DNA-binding transcriptional regulator YiaG